MKTINTMKNNTKLRAGKNPVESWLLRGIYLLSTLFILGVGQMWAADVAQNAIIYMDNSAAGWDYNSIYFVINNTNGYPMTAVANTKLYVHKRSAGTWSGYSNVRFFAATASWGGDDASMGSESNMVSYGANLTNTQTNYGFNGNNFYVIKLDKAGAKTSSSTRANLSTSYIGTAYSSMNKTITVKAKVSTDGGSSYSEATSPGTLSASSNKFTAYNSCASGTSLSSGTISCGYTATTTLTAADATGYDFVGWYNSSGTQQTTSKTLTIYPTANATYYAYYKLKQYTVSYGVYASSRYGSIKLNSGSAITTTSSSTLNHGTSIAFTATPDDGYQVEGWYSDASCTVGNRLQSGGNSYDAGTLTAATTVYVKFEAKTGGIITLTAGANGQVSTDNSAWGSEKTISSITSATPVNIYAQANSGYSFSTWTKSSGSGSVTTNAASGVFTPVAYEDATVTASFAENMTTVTINVNPSGAGTLTVGGAAFTAGNTTTAGVSTSRTVVATANSGKVFLDWSVSGNATGTNSTNTYTLKGNGSAGTGTLTANFGIASGWYMEGTNFGGWVRPNTAAYQFARPYRGMENVFYYPTSLAASSYWKVNDGTKPYSISNSSVAITKKTIYSLTEEWINSTYASSAMSNIWVVLDKANKKLWVQDPQTFYNVNVTGNNDSKGPTAVTLKTTSAFTKGSNTFNTTQFANGETFTVTVTGVSGWIPTITIGGVEHTFWKEAASYSADGTMGTSDVTVTISYTASYAVTFATTTGCNSLSATGPSSTAITTGTKVKSGTSITFAQSNKTGYTFTKWYSTSTGTGGTQHGIEASLTKSITAATAVYPIYTANSYTITLDVDEDHKGTIAGATTSQTIHFDETTTTVPNRPTAEQGYGLEGYFTDQNGNGTKLINGDGTWIASVAGYTDANKKWIHDGDVTLYAYYKKATISAITLTPAATVAPSTTVTATPVISPTPTGPVIVCWRLLHSNGNIMDEQPEFTPGAGNAVSFTAPDASSTYKVACILRTGDACGAGSVIDSTTVNLQTAGDHTVTVQYKCGTETIKASTTVEGKPLVWSDAITAPEIFGYTFSNWTAVDGVTLSTNGTSALGSNTTTTATIYIKANYDGKLTANYTQDNIIYFKNTLGWSTVRVHFLDGDYWTTNKGSGNNSKENCNIAMTRLGETDVWYYDYGAASITPTRYIAFTQESMSNYENFSQNAPNVAHVVFPTRYTDALTTDKGTEGGFYAGTPMFVPRAGQTGIMQNNSRAAYYNEGYWTKYTPGTGYSLKIYNAAGNALLKDIPFTSEDELMPMTAVVDLEATTTYKFELMREGDVYYGNDNAMTYTNHGQDVPWEMSWKEGGHKCGLTTNAAGEYTFHLTYSAYSNQYRLRMSYDYPIATGDYRVIYKDNVHTLFKPSAIVPKVNNGKDTVSFFIRPGDTPVMKIQQATVNSSTGVVTWSAGTDITTAAGLTSLPQDSVYNICLQMNGSGAISVENVEAYTGDFYIRVDCANNKWDNFKNADHALTYSEYSETYSDYTHYWMAHTWRNDNTNIKFVIANDYSPCISDTMIRSNYRGSDEDFVDEYGTITPEANIRFMWNRSDNTINRAYLSPAKKDGSQFLVLRGYNGGSGDKDDNLLSEADTELEGNPGDTGTNNHAGGDHCMQFTDNENWIYEALVKVKPDTYVKLFARFAITINNETELPVTYTDLYYKGDSGDNFNGNDDDGDGIPNAIKLITGDSEDHLLVRVIYDFKTDRLLAAYIPSGNITTEMNINADVMFIREHQSDISQITFSDSGAIKEIKTAYAVMRFNKWTLNNKSKEAPHSPLGVPLSRYERDLFYISFPFDVNLNEVFGFGTYGVHWIIEEYDGAGRAQKGFWQDSPTFWKFITNRNGKVLKKNVGYLLALDLDELGEDAAVWGVAENDRAELFFPSSGTMPNITNSSVTDNLPEHTCTIVRDGADRRLADSHWNIMGVPTYVNTKNVSFANTTWTTAPRDPANGHFGGPNFLYTWNPDDNSLTPTSATTFTYHAMHAYTVQYCGDVTWTTSVSPSAIVARERQAPNAYEWCLEIQKDSGMIDRTYVRMTDEEEVTTGFEFGYDMSKDLNKNRAGIYSFITTAESTEMAAGNCLPLETEQTTLVPLGVSIPSTGDYTFAMPAGTSGVGVTLYDNVANVRTNLSALDYTVNLTVGDYTSRFFLEIPPVQPIHTDLEPTSDSSLKGRAQKKIIDGLLYIVRDGKMYDARGARVE